MPAPLRINEVPEVSELLNAARSVAIAEISGADATPEVLRRFAARIRELVLDQADAGAWAVLDVHGRGALLGLAVRAEVVSGITGGVRIAVSYDFSRTRIPRLLVRDRGVPVRA